MKDLLNIIIETCNGFQGVDLVCSYLCPECILGLKTSLSALPEEITKFSEFSFAVTRKETSSIKETTASERKCILAGHLLERSWIEEGFSPKFKSGEIRVKETRLQGGSLQIDDKSAAIAILEKLKLNGVQYLEQIPLEVWEEMNLTTALSDCWFSFGENFLEIEATLMQLRFSEIPPREKVAMILKDLISSSILIDRFLQVLIKSK